MFCAARMELSIVMKRWTVKSSLGRYCAQNTFDACVERPCVNFSMVAMNGRLHFFHFRSIFFLVQFSEYQLSLLSWHVCPVSSTAVFSYETDC